MTVTYYVFHNGNKIFQKNEDHSEGQVGSHMSYLWEYWHKYIKKGAHKVCAVRQGKQTCYDGPATKPSVALRRQTLQPSKATLPMHTDAKHGVYQGLRADRRPFSPATVKGAEGVPMFKWISKRDEKGIEARLHGIGLGAPPPVVKRWFPERKDSEWDDLDDADKASLLNQASAVDAKWNATIQQYKAEGACDATKPGRLAGALRAYLIASGGEVENLGDDEDKFGPLECKEWMRVFNKQPDLASAKDSIKAGFGSVQTGTPTYGWRTVYLADICGSKITLPVCQPPAGPPPPAPQCSDKKPCPVGEKCVDGKCVKVVAEGEPKKSNWLWLLALGAGGLAVAGAAGMFPKGPKNLPPREAERLMENAKKRRRPRRCC